jgi:hypothetical protein
VVWPPGEFERSLEKLGFFNCIKRLLTTKRRKLGEDGKNFLKLVTRAFDPE